MLTLFLLAALGVGAWYYAHKSAPPVPLRRAHPVTRLLHHPSVKQARTRLLPPAAAPANKPAAMPLVVRPVKQAAPTPTAQQRCWVCGLPAAQGTHNHG